MPQRIDAIDFLKFFGILAVILGHFASPLSAFIFSWHMPLFFMISGFFVRFDQSPREFLKKEWVRLMIPYFLFSALALVVEVSKRKLLYRNELDLVSEIHGIFWNMDISVLGDHYGFVLWFLPAVFWARSFLYFSRRFVGSSIRVAAIAVPFFALSFWYDLPFGLDQGMNAFLWVYLGNVLYPKVLQSEKLWFAAGPALILYLMYGFPVLDMAKNFYAVPVLNIAWAICMVFLFMYSCRTVKISDSAKRWPARWGKETMILFIIHPYTNNAGSLMMDGLGLGSAWYLKFLISILLLQLLLMTKEKKQNWVIFRYV